MPQPKDAEPKGLTEDERLEARRVDAAIGFEMNHTATREGFQHHRYGLIEEEEADG